MPWLWAVCAAELLASRADASFTICSINVNRPPPAAADYGVVGDSFLAWEGGGKIALRGSLRLVEAPLSCPPVNWDFSIQELQLHGNGTDLFAPRGSASLPPDGALHFASEIGRQVQELSDGRSIVDIILFTADPGLAGFATYSDQSRPLPEAFGVELLIQGMRTEEQIFPGGGGSSVTLGVSTLGTARLELQRLPEPRGSGLVLLAISAVLVLRSRGEHWIESPVHPLVPD